MSQPPAVPARLDTFFQAVAAARAKAQPDLEKDPDAEDEANVKSFAARHSAEGLKVVLVTSGGTTVPLEANTVRFLDNFSSGRRGAAMVEQYLRKGYAVVFLTRVGSAKPFARLVQDATSTHFDTALLDTLQLFNKPGGTEGVQLTSQDSATDAMLTAIKTYQAVKGKGLLLEIPFMSLTDYLLKLRSCTRGLQDLGRNAQMVFAAAVSDFYIPINEMAEHKIQSRDGPLQLVLEQTPKALGAVRHVWAPQAHVVSFKLETDREILIPKARGAIENYNVHLVVANELKSRYQHVFLVSSANEETIERGDSELEVPLVEALCEAHKTYADGADE
mmetsp:Transcript_9797/g.17262  ORF Transcript_9797/g.17262 Transcript_9797/m.17262 type:complete len:333 (+) Transcript_9797:89-1087(+)